MSKLGLKSTVLVMTVLICFSASTYGEGDNDGDKYRPPYDPESTRNAPINWDLKSDPEHTYDPYFQYRPKEGYDPKCGYEKYCPDPTKENEDVDIQRLPDGSRRGQR